MWLIQFLPTAVMDWLIDITIVVGLAVTVLSFVLTVIPLVNVYRTWFKVAGIVLLTVGVYFKGGSVVEHEWRARVAELEDKVREAEARSAETNTVIQTRWRERTKVIKQQQVVYQDRVVKEREVIDRQCTVTPQAISILNDAARVKQGTVDVGPLREVEK
jgi:preprotein translocase subunit SecF